MISTKEITSPVVLLTELLKQKQVVSFFELSVAIQESSSDTTYLEATRKLHCEISENRILQNGSRVFLPN